jgi:hypothetical protein
MGSKLSLVLGLTAAIAFGAATPSNAQRLHHHPHAVTPPHHQPAHINASDASTAFGRAAPVQGPGGSTDGREQARCFVSTDSDHDFGYWGSCSSRGARPVK